MVFGHRWKTKNGILVNDLPIIEGVSSVKTGSMIAFGGWGCNFTSGHTRWYKLESTEESDRLPKVISFAQKIDTTRGRCQALGKSFLAGGFNPSERY